MTYIKPPRSKHGHRMALAIGTFCGFWPRLTIADTWPAVTESLKAGWEESEHQGTQCTAHTRLRTSGKLVWQLRQQSVLFEPKSFCTCTAFCAVERIGLWDIKAYPDPPNLATRNPIPACEQTLPRRHGSSRHLMCCPLLLRVNHILSQRA